MAHPLDMTNRCGDCHRPVREKLVNGKCGICRRTNWRSAVLTSSPVLPIDPSVPIGETPCSMCGKRRDQQHCYCKKCLAKYMRARAAGMKYAKKRAA